MNNLGGMGVFQNAFSLLLIQDILWLSSSDTLPTGDLFRNVIASLVLLLNLFVEAAIFFLSRSFWLRGCDCIQDCLSYNRGPGNLQILVFEGCLSILIYSWHFIKIICSKRVLALLLTSCLLGICKFLDCSGFFSFYLSCTLGCL